MSLESYNPSKSEVKEAESNMSPKQEAMSDIRTEDYNKVLKYKDGKKIIEDLADGKFDLDIKESGPYTTISGKIGDSSIKIIKTTGNGFSGEIDGQEIDGDTVKMVYNKYEEIALLQDKQKSSFFGIFKGKSRSEEEAEQIVIKDKLL